MKISGTTKRTKKIFAWTGRALIFFVAIPGCVLYLLKL